MNNQDKPNWIEEIDSALQQWRQGDYVLGELWFVYRFNPQQPLTPDSLSVAQENTDLTESEVRGLVVVTQTCDLVRSCYSRPFVEVVPLLEVDKQQLYDIKRSRRPQYAYIPGAAKDNLVADLDRVMTVEKAVVAQWKRSQGCYNDEETRALSLALTRKSSRFAFPDDFIEFAQELKKKLEKKHNKISSEGEALRALREIRVRAAPSWEASNIELMFWFIRDSEQVKFNNSEWSTLLEQWLKLIPKSGRFQSVYGLIVALEDITAKDYVESEPLDLDHLSSSL